MRRLAPFFFCPGRDATSHSSPWTAVISTVPWPRSSVSSVPCIGSTWVTPTSQETWTSSRTTPRWEIWTWWTPEFRETWKVCQKPRSCGTSTYEDHRSQEIWWLCPMPRVWVTWTCQRQRSTEMLWPWKMPRVCGIWTSQRPRSMEIWLPLQISQSWRICSCRTPKPPAISPWFCNGKRSLTWAFRAPKSAVIQRKTSKIAAKISGLWSWHGQRFAFWMASSHALRLTFSARVYTFAHSRPWRRSTSPESHWTPPWRICSDPSLDAKNCETLEQQLAAWRGNCIGFVALCAESCRCWIYLPTMSLWWPNYLTMLGIWCWEKIHKSVSNRASWRGPRRNLCQWTFGMPLLLIQGTLN